MRVTVWFLAAALIAGLTGQGLRAQTGEALSLAEMTIADCVGQALALEQTVRELSGNDAEVQAAATRADALLTIAVTRHVGVSRIEPFRRRASLAQAAESLRLRMAVEITGSASRVIDRAERDFDRGCGAVLQPP